MPHSTLKFASEAAYRAAIVNAYYGEIGGAALIRALIEKFGASSIHAVKLQAMLELELKTAAVLKPLIERYGIGNVSDRNERSEDAEASTNVPDWECLMDMLRNGIPPFIAEFDALALQARAGDEEALSFLAWHERALLAFAEAEYSSPSAANVAILKWNERHEPGSAGRDMG